MSALDVLFLRRPKIDYVSPPVCEAIFSGSGGTVIVLDPFDELGKISGIVVDEEGGSRIVSWPSFPGAICYTIYLDEDGMLTIIAECVEGPSYPLPDDIDGPIRITPITPDGEGPPSDPVELPPGGGGGGCEEFIDNTDLSNVPGNHATNRQASKINGVVAGFKNFTGFQRPWKYHNRVSGDLRSSRSSGAVQASQSASDLINSVANFFEASDVGKFLKFTAGGDAREIIAVNGPTQVQVDVVDTVALDTFTVYSKTFGGASGVVTLCNGAGHYVGWEENVAGDGRVFWFDETSGSYRDIGLINEVIAVDLNENGFLLYQFSDGSAFTTFIYNPNTQTTTQIGVENTTTNALNDNLLVVGAYLFVDHFPDPVENHAYRWQGGVFTDIHPADAGVGPSKFSEGVMVNNAGLVIGEFTHDTLNNRRTFYNVGGASLTIGSFVPGTAANQGYVIAEDMNEAGIVVGLADIEGLSGSGVPNGFKWSQAGGLIRLFPISGHTIAVALSINEAGYIVGSSQLGQETACIWLPGQTIPQDLNSYLPPASGWVLLRATHVTNANEITGWGILNGDHRTFFMKLCL